jgi:hypothetical protein
MIPRQWLTNERDAQERKFEKVRYLGIDHVMFEKQKGTHKREIKKY